MVLPANSHAHAIVGDRVFPATLAIDDPGIGDELTLPQVSRTYADGQWTTDIAAEYDKRLTENLGISIGGDYLTESGHGGFDNIELGAKYVFYKNEPHEFMLSAGLDSDIGNTGAKYFADNFTTLTPALFFGKGLGDLPDSLDWVKPFAVTGTAGLAIPTERYSTDDSGKLFNPNVVQWGGTLQYSLPYLQQHVKDIGLGAPFNTMVPVVEVSLATPTGGDSHVTTGTVNPGIIFMGRTTQVGLEAVVPVNAASGDRVGFIAQLHFYLDDMFPGSFVGTPFWH